jgi:hypothetical protein
MSRPFYTYTQADFTSATNINAAHLDRTIGEAGFASSTFDGLVTSYVGPSDFSCNVIFVDNLLSAGEKTDLDDIIAAYVYVAPKTDRLCTVKDQRSVGTNGGTFTAGTWQVRTLNVLDGDVEFAELKSNQAILQPGTYKVSARAAACNVLAHQIRLRNVTDSTYIYGTNEYSADGVVTYSQLTANIDIAAQKTYELQHICWQTAAGIGFGKATGWTDEVYASVTIEQI